MTEPRWVTRRQVEVNLSRKIKTRLNHKPALVIISTLMMSAKKNVLNATVTPASPKPSKALSLGKGSSEFKVQPKITSQPILGNSLNGLMVPINPQRYKFTKAQRVASVNACRELSEHSSDLQL